MEVRDNWEDTPFIPARDIILIRRISEGAFGMVYKGIYMYQTVAVKVFREVPAENCSSMGSSNSSTDVPLIRQMEHEVRVLRNLRHKNVVGFLGAVEDPPAIVMEYCRSGSLWDVLRRAESSEKIRKKLSWTRRVNLLLGAAQGMAFVHAGIGTKPEILHRDLKSPNVLLDKDWVVKIADFGLSRFVDPHLNTQWDVIANNPTWMPPEVVNISANPHGFTQSMDVYPMGIIMWELMTLEKPWSMEDGTVMRVAQIIACLVLRRDRPPIPRDLSTVPGVKDRTQALEAYITLMAQCWDHEPSLRPTYKEIVVKLQHIKDLFMRRPPPSLDRAKTNDLLIEMLSLWKCPQGVLRDQIPMSDSYMEKVLGGGSLESGSFLYDDPSLPVVEISDLPEVFENEPEGDETNNSKNPETLQNAPCIGSHLGNKAEVPSSIAATLTSPFATMPLPPPMSDPDDIHPDDLDYESDGPLSPAPFPSPFQFPSSQQFTWPPSGDAFAAFGSNSKASESDIEAETQDAHCNSTNDKLEWEAMDEE